MMKGIISNKKCYSFVILTSNLVNKAIILLMYSSSLSGITIRNLKVKHLVDACSDYFAFFEDKNIETLLKKDPANIIPTWMDESSNRLKITFSSPESLFYIFLHLKYRLNIGDVDEEDYLFVNSNGNPISANDITNIFNNSERLNKLMLPRIVGGINIPYDIKFSSKELKRNYISVCENVLPEIEGKKSLIKLLTQGVDRNNPFYDEFLRNVDNLKYNYYREYILPYVTAKNFEIHYAPSIIKDEGMDKCPDIYLKQIITTYSKYKFADEFDVKENISLSREYYDKCLKFQDVLKAKGISNLDDDEEVNDLKEYLMENGLSELCMFLRPDEFEGYVETIESEDFKEGYLGTLYFEKTMKFFINLCIEYNDAKLFKASDDFFDEVWLKADIQSYLEHYERRLSKKITKDNVNQKMLFILALLNEVHFFDRYDFKESMYENNEDFNPATHVSHELKEMLLRELDFREVSSININFNNIVEMLQALDLRFK